MLTCRPCSCFCGVKNRFCPWHAQCFSYRAAMRGLHAEGCCLYGLILQASAVLQTKGPAPAYSDCSTPDCTTDNEYAQRGAAGPVCSATPRHRIAGGEGASPSTASSAALERRSGPGDQQSTRTPAGCADPRARYSEGQCMPPAYPSCLSFLDRPQAAEPGGGRGCRGMRQPPAQRWPCPRHPPTPRVLA